MANSRVPQDLSHVRGFNYQSTVGHHHTDHWLYYDPIRTDFELDLARRLNLNQTRVFISYDAYLQDKQAFLGNMTHLVRACDQRGIGLMVVVVYPIEMVTEKESWPVFREYAADLVHTLSGEPGLAFWDVSNEPDYTGVGVEVAQKRMDHARYMADVFHELDSKTPVTIGANYVWGMEALNDSVDVLSFHDYSPTRAEIRANIARAKQFAATVGKPVFDTEIGCIGRANPYDVAIEEHMKAAIGWYIWELMITGYWGNVHGVFYEDGTVRDPSIAAAVLGFFRKRGPEIMPTVLDREGHVQRIVNDSKAWLAQSDHRWDEGLELAEAAAHLLEAGEIVALGELPTREIYLMGDRQPDTAALSSLLAISLYLSLMC